jgi:predicted nucleic acid-binding protein
LTLEEALPIQEEAESMMAQNEYEVSSSQILALVKESHCSAYDCEFIALAQQLQIPLITEDKKVLNEFPTIALSITEFLQQPR